MLKNQTIALNKLGELINVELRQSHKAKNIAIRIKREKIELVLPYRVPKKLGYDFLLSKEAWIRNKLDNKREVLKERDITHREYHILNNTYKLKHIHSESRFSAAIDGDHIVAYSSSTQLINTLTNFFKDVALTEIKAITERFAQQNGFKYNKISIKELSSKWGSCSSLKNLAFNWRIIFAPTHVIHYLIIHELCHLKEMNHSAKFWRLVSDILPDYKASRKWLKEHGYSLYYYL